MNAFEQAVSKGLLYSDQIAITSLSGAGSSSALKLLKQKFYKTMYRFGSGGDAMRTFASLQNMEIEEFTQYMREHPEAGFDQKMDDLVKVLAQQNFFIFEGRLAHINLPMAFKVLITCPRSIRAKRRQADPAYSHLSLPDVIDKIQQRDEDDNSRYEKLYPGCIWKEDRFDFVIDSSQYGQQELVNEILKAHEDWKEAHPRRMVREADVRLLNF
jgi:cytidylate kinase